ncbi:MAG: hypothetical protein MJH09_06495 [Cetobacterium sp.]|nr:hypothetical protein [Cetobacterium sp.]
MNKKLCLCLYLLVYLNSFGIGRDILNFYVDEFKENLYQSYGELEKKNDKEFYKWKIALGTSKLNETWSFDYDIERKFNKESTTSGWENTFALYNKLVKKNWYIDFGPYVKFNINDITEDFTKDFKENQYAFRYRVRTNTVIELGEIYYGTDFLISLIDTNLRDGISLEGNLTGAISLGYGFQNFFTVYNKYLNYNENRGTYLFRIENIFRWTYDLSENFVFSIDSEIDSYNYFKNTNEKKFAKFNIGPYILYSQNLQDDFRIFAKIGIIGYNYEKAKTKIYNISESKFYIKMKLGFEYIF